MTYTLLLILLWPLMIFLCYKFIRLNINEIESRETKNKDIKQENTKSLE